MKIKVPKVSDKKQRKCAQLTKLSIELSQILRELTDDVNDEPGFVGSLQINRPVE